MDSRLSILTIFASALLLGVGAEYVLRSLMLMEKDSHEGPFPSDKEVRYVRFESTGHMQKVALFDWIRRLFRVYLIEERFGVEEWVVVDERAAVQRFTCPHCLSWWTSLPFSLGLTLAAFGSSASFLIWIIPIHLFIAVISQVVYGYLWDNEA